MNNRKKRSTSLILALIFLVGQFPATNRRVFAKHISVSRAAGRVPASESTLHEANSETKHRMAEAYGRLPLSFESNEGQFDSRVKFASRGSGYSLLLTETDAILELQSGEMSIDLRMKFAGANPNAQIEGIDPLPGKSNYLAGNDRSKWRTNVANYAKVRYREIYRGIDIVFYDGLTERGRQLEYDFVVKPGADTTAIKIVFNGTESLKIDRNGDLILRTSGGEVRQRKPVIYQEVNETKSMIAGRYVIRGKNRLGFEVAAYDRSRPLVIDPVLVYSTDGIGGVSIAVDSGGNAHVVGTTTLADFPLKDPLQNQIGGAEDVFIAKLNATGTALIYSTFLGGEGSDAATAIAVDAQGNAYIAGNTQSANFPGAGPRSRIDSDAFVVKLNSTGSSIVYSRYLGGSNVDSCNDLAVDASGQVYITGETASSDFSITPNALKTVLPSSNPQPSDAFVTKLGDSGAILYSTYLGGNAIENGKAIALDTQGNVYVTGETLSTDFPVKGGLQTKSGTTFVTKLNLNQSGSDALVYSSLFKNAITDIGVDNAGNSYLLFNSVIDLRPTSDAFQSAPGPAFLAKLNPDGSEMIYGTFLGGFGSYQWVNPNGTFTANFSDKFSRMAVDGAGNVYLAGTAEFGTRFVTTADAAQKTTGGCFLTPHTPPVGCNDATMMKFNSVGALVYSSFLGGSSDDFGRGIAVDASGAFYVTGETSSSTFPRSSDALPRTAQKGFVAKIGSTTPVATVANVSAASYGGSELAPESIAAAFGISLATSTSSAPADAIPLPTSLVGTTVKVRDSAGMERLAPLFFVSEKQVNYQMPPGSEPGDAMVTITSSINMISNGAVRIVDVAPGMFTADASGSGFAAALAQRLRNNTTIAYEPVARFDAQQNRFVSIPIDLGPEGDQVYLVLFGTGFRRRSALSAVSVKIGDMDVSINYAGPQLQLVGLDQINALLPRSLAGRGEVNVLVTVDGKTANAVRVNIK